LMSQVYLCHCKLLKTKPQGLKPNMILLLFRHDSKSCPDTRRGEQSQWNSGRGSSFLLIRRD
jgi:hypothetical protein